MKLLSLACMLLLATILFSIPSVAVTTQPQARYRLDSEHLSPRDCILQPSGSVNFDCDLKMPTLAQIKAKMLDPAYGGSVTKDIHVFFYSNLGDRQVCVPWMVGWLHSKGTKEHCWSDNAVGGEWYRAQDSWIRGHEQSMRENAEQNVGKLFRNCYVEALASAAINPIVYFFTSFVQEPGQTSIWTRIEFPALTNNPNVKEIWRVDPRPPNLKGEKCDGYDVVLMWSREKGDMEMSSGDLCPWR